MRRFFLLSMSLSGCLFDPEQTEGLPCNADADCGSGVACSDHVCGGIDTPAGSSDESTSGGSAESDDAPSEEESTAALPTACTAEDTECIDDDILRSCDDGKLSTIGCRGRCGEAEPSLGCHYYAEESRDTCYCAGALPTCEATNEYTCAPGNALGSCVDGYLDPVDCDEICVDAGYGGGDVCGAAPEGSGDTCFCGNTCAEGASRCVGAGTNSVCSGGQWYSSTCEEICLANGYAASLGCRYDTTWADSGCGCI